MLVFSEYLDADVELTEEREEHIRSRHPDLLPRYRSQVLETILSPDQVRRSSRADNARLFCRWFDDVRGGKFVVVVVVNGHRFRRNWVATSYMTMRLAEGEIEWERN